MKSKTNLDYSIKLTKSDLIYIIGVLTHFLKLCRSFQDGDRIENLIIKYVKALARKDEENENI